MDSLPLPANVSKPECGFRSACRRVSFLSLFGSCVVHHTTSRLADVGGQALIGGEPMHEAVAEREHRAFPCTKRGRSGSHPESCGEVGSHGVAVEGSIPITCGAAGT